MSNRLLNDFSESLTSTMPAVSPVPTTTAEIPSLSMLSKSVPAYAVDEDRSLANAPKTNELSSPDTSASRPTTPTASPRVFLFNKRRSKGRPRFRTVRVGNLPPNVDADQVERYLCGMIQNAFKDRPEVTRCDVFPEQEVALLEFATHLSAKRATNLKRKTWNGRDLTIKALRLENDVNLEDSSVPIKEQRSPECSYHGWASLPEDCSSYEDCPTESRFLSSPNAAESGDVGTSFSGGTSRDSTTESPRPSIMVPPGFLARISDPPFLSDHLDEVSSARDLLQQSLNNVTAQYEKLCVEKDMSSSQYKQTIQELQKRNRKDHELLLDANAKVADLELQLCQQEKEIYDLRAELGSLKSLSSFVGESNATSTLDASLSTISTIPNADEMSELVASVVNTCLEPP